MSISNIFPLSIYHNKISLSDDERTNLVDEISFLYDKSPKINSKNSSWTGDVNGSEFLFRNKKFKKIASLISEKIYDYLNELAIDKNLVDLYFQRSWATITSKKQNISWHTHSQSNISFAYYLLKPPKSGSILFKSENPPNAISKNIFSADKVNKSLIKNLNPLNINLAEFDLSQDSIVIFPSQTLHSTGKNNSTKKRISLSGDVTLMLKNSDGYEHLMPNFNKWTKL